MNATTTAPHSTTAVQPGRPPGIVPLLNPVLRRLLAAGVPLGPNALLTVRGRRTGQLRTTPLAIMRAGLFSDRDCAIDFTRNRLLVRNSKTDVNRPEQRVSRQ